MTEYDEWKAAEALDYLRRVRRAAVDVRRLNREIEDARSMLPSGTDVTREKVKSSPRPDALERQALRVLDLIERYCTELGDYLDLVDGAADAIGALQDERHRAVLALYYIDGLRWREVAESVHYAEEYCKRMRTAALPMLWEHLPRGERTSLPRAD